MVYVGLFLISCECAANVFQLAEVSWATHVYLAVHVPTVTQSALSESVFATKTSSRKTPDAVSQS